MLDTLGLAVQDGHYRFGENVQFNPSAELLYSRWGLWSVKLIVPKDLKGYYFPQVYFCKCRRDDSTGEKRCYYELHIECSVAKLLKGENLFSIRESQKEEFAHKLSQVLKMAGITVSPEDIITASTTKLHIAHNMVLDYPVNMVVDEIAMADAWKYDPSTEKDGFRNGGECYHIHHNAYELAFYNKVTDMERLQGCTKHAVDGELYPNLSVYQKYLNGQSKHILRMELRINDTNYIKKEVNSILGRPANTTVTVGDCFNNALAQQILLKQWQKVEEACFKLPVYRRDSTKLFAEIKRRNPKRQDAHLWKAAYILQMIAEKGRVFVKNTLASMYGKVKAETMIKDALTLKFTRRQPNYIAQIGQELKKFNPLTPAVLTNKVNKSTIKLNMDSTKFLTVEEMADILKVVPMTIYRYLKAGKLTAYKFGKEYRVYEKDFKEFLASCKIAKKGGTK